MEFDPLHNPFSSKRTPVYAQNGMVATSQPLAAQAGLRILQQGGNAIDAAIATAAALTVVEPTSNGIGGDAFALVWHNGSLQGLNGSGPAPQRLSVDEVKKRGHTRMPSHGWLPVTVPGAPATWAALSERFGTLPLSQCLVPAIEYAEQGYPLSPALAWHWQRGFRKHRKLQGDEYLPGQQLFFPDGRAPVAGEIWRSPDHARSLRLIGETRAEAFYRGELADEIDRFSRQSGGLLRKSDLAEFSPQWVTPLSVDYRGYQIWEIPPNGQGLVALMALNTLSGFELTQRDHVDTLHRQIEALKLAFADGQKYITDPDAMTVDPQALLSPSYAAERRAQIGKRAHLPTAGKPQGSGTVYLATADNLGNMVSFIQSNYMDFGSGITVPGSGIALQNRGHNFSLDPTHANVLQPGKRSYHTIIPGFITRDSEAVGPLGVMGAFMQPQGHVQVATNLIDFQLNPQAALDAPRWQWLEGLKVSVESGMPEHVIRQLLDKGHDLHVAAHATGFGRGQVIVRNPETGVLCGGTESRTDGHIAAW